MKIGLSTSVVQRGRSGIGQYVLALVRAWLARPTPHEFTLFVLEDDLDLFRFASSSMRLVPVPERFRPPVKNILWHQTRLPRLARRLNLDVLHVPSYRRMLWPQPCPLVATIHDLAPFRLQKKYDPLRMFYGRVVARRLARRQHRLIAVSHHTARDIHTCFQIPPERLTVIHNGLDHDRFFPASRDQARRETADHHDLNAPFFLYVARLEHPAKNHVRLIESFNRFKARTRSNWKLVLAGSDWHGAEIIRSTAARSPHRRDILFPGFVPDADLPAWYRAAEAFVYPSLYEGFGLPPLEAMACGCPVISSPRGSLAEVVGEAGLIVHPEDEGEITDSLRRLAGDADLRARLREQGLAHARGFDWRRTADATMEVYERACTASRAPSESSLQSSLIPSGTASTCGCDPRTSVDCRENIQTLRPRGSLLPLPRERAGVRASSIDQ